MVEPRLVGEAAPLLVGKLRRASAAGEANSQRSQNRQRAGIDAVSGIGKAGRPRQTVLLAAGVDGLDLFLELRQVLPGDRKMIAGVVADLEAVAVQVGDLL